jgi:hypothetical protein
MKKTLIVLALLSFAVASFAADPPEGYEWVSKHGALKITIQNPHVYIFDTYEPLTIAKNKTVAWEEVKDTDLTDLGKDLRGRLLKINDIASVFVGYRVIMFRKFPLSTWEKLMPEIKNALE